MHRMPRKPELVLNDKRRNLPRKERTLTHYIALAITVFRKRQTPPQARCRICIMVAATAALKPIAMMTFTARRRQIWEVFGVLYSRSKRDQQEGRKVFMQVLNGGTFLISDHIGASRHKRQTQYSSINPSHFLTSWQAAAGWHALTR